MNKTLLSTTAALIGLAGAAAAQCTIEGEGSVRILANDFQALHAVVARAAECASDTVEVTTNETTEHKDIQVAALSTDPAAYTVAVVANGSLVPLLNEGLTRPLDDLVEQYGQNLQESQLIRIDGQIMAIAFMANSQMLHYRADILEENGIAVPTTYEELIEASAALREAGVMETPLYASFKPGWDLGEEFINMYMGSGQPFFEPGSAVPAINNEAGIAALEMMKQMTEYMGPDMMTYNSNEAQPYWENEEVAFMTGWGSRTAAFIDENGATPEIAAETEVVAMPGWGGNGIPATTLWWDGFAMAKNISDEDAAVSFQAMMYALSPELVADPETAALAAWLVNGYEPQPAAAGVIANMQAGAAPYPMTPYMGLLHTALGDNLAEFLQGQESAEEALEDVVAAYTTAATEAGFIQ
ncbi:ABC transporter substrate-binding protein [Wenxinia marina]|uniref:Carbohydrate ABC transporter substrate-binding protein, CUT1 family n=1 Tax=Wenxinia marina DSM 24838 TaxID=1123501 RepID=A0A0D0Q5P7_9RHOB|nr:extracellular solute-binding protein [Wenxinia marina]KIQ69794.1 carbohydrate ABC transporter substrate-binding protein, CUT1 family [Wenxinia marina DSM 24838]GGL61245.1 sugar ABC transporter substrate-binding protein [Wenxinia marina]